MLEASRSARTAQYSRRHPISTYSYAPRESHHEDLCLVCCVAPGVVACARSPTYAQLSSIVDGHESWGLLACLSIEASASTFPHLCGALGRVRYVFLVPPTPFGFQRGSIDCVMLHPSLISSASHACVLFFVVLYRAKLISLNSWT
jgi:hypothetical protein